MNILYAYAAILLLSAGILAIVATRDTFTDSLYAAAVAILIWVISFVIYQYA